MPKPTFHLRIISPQQLLLDTEVESLSSKNLQGPFDILPQHANFITLIENTPIVVRVPGQKPQTFSFPLAIIMATENKVNIYTYIQPNLDKKS
jgi:F0F1-type ATP synthase epsilon subunit